MEEIIMEYLVEQLKIVWLVIGSWMWIYISIYSIKHAWENAKNSVVSKRKVCDSCWRDIKKVNEALK